MRKLIALLLLLMLLPAVAVAAPESLSLPEFAGRLERAAGAVEQNRPEDARHILADWETVDAPGGAVSVDMRWLNWHVLGGLTAAERTRLTEQLRTMARQAREVERSGQPGLEARLKQAATDRETLNQILSSAGYRQAELPSWWSRFWEGVATWWREIWQRIVDWWRRQWSWVPDLPGLPRGLASRVVGGVVALLLLGAGLYLTWHLLRNRAGRRKRGLVPLPPAAPADMRRAALALAEAGDRRAGIKLLMQAVLGRLADRRLIEWQPFLTNRGCLRQLRRRSPELAPALEELNGLYEWKVYGGRPASPEEFRRGMDLADRLWEEGSSSNPS